jgi:carbamoyltransferase
MLILGISAFYHDSAAALIKDGEIIAAAQEERFTRKKHDASFPINAINYCLTEGGVSGVEIDRVAYYEKPFIKFDRLIETYLTFAPKGFSSFRKAMPLWLSEKLFQKDLILDKLSQIDKSLGFESKILFSEHHFSHAASAFYPSPFEEAAVLTMDGVGEWTTTSLAIGQKSNLSIIKEIHFPHSIGLLYSAFTYYTGFKVNSGEYKVMGLAPYGEPRFASLIKDKLIDIKEDGSFRLNMDYFDYCTELKMTGARFEELFGLPTRSPEQQLTQDHMDLAASVQKVAEDIILLLARSIASQTGQKNLCLAGGVALNCVANGKLHREQIFNKIFVQPASGDAGGAIGAALAAYHHQEDKPRKVSFVRDGMKGGYLGPAYTTSEIEQRLLKVGAIFETVDDHSLIELTAEALASEQAVGWRQGRLEFGPRALGGSSILADPRAQKMQKNLNLKVKFRESFRPFAPSILGEKVEEWFEFVGESPYMLMVADVKEDRRREMSAEEKMLFGIEKLNVIRSEIPAVTHVDYSARIQTVHEDTNPKYYQLIKAFEAKTGCPILVNTSFNVRGEPIVCTPEDAFNCFMGTNLDFLAVGNCILYKSKQNSELALNYEENFELD